MFVTIWGQKSLLSLLVILNIIFVVIIDCCGVFYLYIEYKDPYIAVYAVLGWREIQNVSLMVMILSFHSASPYMMATRSIVS